MNLISVVFYTGICCRWLPHSCRLLSLPRKDFLQNARTLKMTCWSCGRLSHREMFDLHNGREICIFWWPMVFDVHKKTRLVRFAAFNDRWLESVIKSPPKGWMLGKPSIAWNILLRGIIKRSAIEARFSKPLVLVRASLKLIRRSRITEKVFPNPLMTWKILLPSMSNIPPTDVRIADLPMLKKLSAYKYVKFLTYWSQLRTFIMPLNLLRYLILMLPSTFLRLSSPEIWVQKNNCR